MEISGVLSNEFRVRFDEARQIIEVTRIANGKSMGRPIEILLSTLVEMDDPQEACRWFGETILLLIPEFRKSLFKLS